MTDRQAKIMWTWAIASALALVVALASGCSTPEAIRRLESESVASIEAYHANANRAVEGLAARFEAASLKQIEATTELALHEETETVLVAQEEGDPVPRYVIAPEKAAEAARLALEKVTKVGQEVDEFRAAWRGAEGDYLNALRLRGRIRDYLRRGGIEEEQIEALADALAREIESRR